MAAGFSLAYIRSLANQRMPYELKVTSSKYRYFINNLLRAVPELNDPTPFEWT